MFHTRYGYFEYLVILFGLTNTLATCQALINDTLREYLDLFCVVYLDDILIYSKDLELHKEHVRKVLDQKTLFDDTPLTSSPGNWCQCMLSRLRHPARRRESMH